MRHWNRNDPRVTTAALVLAFFALILLDGLIGLIH